MRINLSSPFCSYSAPSALTGACTVLSTVAPETMIAALISHHTQVLHLNHFNVHSETQFVSKVYPLYLSMPNTYKGN